jgi:hypothetical protein
MADICLAEQTKPSTPASGNGVMWPDSTSPQWFTIDDAGRVWGRSFNAAVAAQGAGFATDTYVTNSDILIPSFGLQAKTLIRWTISASKTAAGVATPIYSVRIGSARTTADTARLAITGPAQTAAADSAVIQILLAVRTVAATGVIQGTVSMDHNLAATGFATDASSIVVGTSAGFDNSALGGSYIGLSIDGGASAAWTITQVTAEAAW